MAIKPEEACDSCGTSVPRVDGKYPTHPNILCDDCAAERGSNADYGDPDEPRNPDYEPGDVDSYIAEHELARNETVGGNIDYNSEEILKGSRQDKARDPRRKVGATSPMMMGGVEGLDNDFMSEFFGPAGKCAYGACGNDSDPKSMLKLCPGCHEDAFGSKYLRGDR